jgi:hypothetical protein
VVAKLKSCLDCFFHNVKDQCGRLMKMNYCLHTPLTYRTCEDERKNEKGCGKKGKYFKRKELK